MADSDGLQALEGLHSDLVAFSQDHLHDIDRLVAELESRIEEFRTLLNKRGKADTSRRKLNEGKITIGEVEYSINDEFKQQAIEVSDELDIDELDAARLVLEAQEDAAEIDRSPTVCAIIRYHKRRLFLLEALRVLLTLTQDEEFNQETFSRILEIKSSIVVLNGTHSDTRQNYWNQCFSALQDIELWLRKLADRSQRVSIIGYSLSEEALELLELESTSLLQQHESLATILSLLIKDNDAATSVQNFELLLQKARSLDKHDVILIHHIPILLGFVAQFGDADAGHCTEQEATAINNIFLAQKESESWSLRDFHAAVSTWWSAEYFSKYKNDIKAAEQAEEAEKERFEKALQDGSFHFTLSIASDVRKPDWYDPAKQGLLSFLLQDSIVLGQDVPKPAAFFQRLLMDHLQLFVGAFITNMPNLLRNLKYEEDKVRLELLARFQKNPNEQPYHLERFLVIFALAYENSPDSALMCWEDSDSNLYGFLQWAAKRQTTPRVAAFCEMLGALAESEDNANAAHQFLLEEGSPVAGKLRRNGSLSWNQIYAEIFFYAKTIRDKPAVVQSTEYAAAPGALQDIVEPESAIMLECYLRLVTQLCLNGSHARTFVLEWQHEGMALRDILFQLASSQIDSRLRACAFATLSALLTNKKRVDSDDMWVKLDLWISGGANPQNTQPARQASRSSWSEQLIFESIAAGFEEANAFVTLMNTLIRPCQNEPGLNDTLPYPEVLGSAYRMAGIESYVDFTVGKAFGEKTSQLTDLTQLRLLRFNTLDFIATALSTFNEDLVVVANRSSFPVDAAMHTSSLEAYVRLHPFARVMEWLYNDRVLVALFASAHQDINEVNMATHDSPLVASIVRAVEVMNLIMALQPTYNDIVRPLVQSKSSTRKSTIAHSTITSFEDAITNNLDIVVDLGLYCGTGHQDLALTSLALLEKLSSSKKLVVSPAAGFGKFSDRSKLIGVFEKNDDAERVSRTLIGELRIDSRELEAQEGAPGYVIKKSILNFLKHCLFAVPNAPTLAHLLLGFICRVRELEIAPDGQFAQGDSLFHSIAALAVNYPEVGPVHPDMPVRFSSPLLPSPEQHPYAGQASFFSWLSNIRVACMEVLWMLWKSPLSSSLVMTELRSGDFIFALVTKQGILSPNTIWDGNMIRDGGFLYTESAVAMQNALLQRAAIYDYLARELRVATSQKMSSLAGRLQSTLLGQTKFPGSPPQANPTIFDFFDFMELDIPSVEEVPELDLLRGVDFEACRIEGKGSNTAYDLDSAQELILLRRNELQGISQPPPSEELMEQFSREFSAVRLHLHGINQSQELLATHSETLRYWSQLVIIAIESCNFDAATRSSFAMQIFQLVLPKVERALSGYDSSSASSAQTLLKLLAVLMKHVDLEQKTDTRTDFGNDRVFNVFRTALNGIYVDIATPELRELSYSIVYHYLSVTLHSSKKGATINRHVIRSVKLAGERLIDVLCDDAYSGESKCRIGALMVLDALVLLSNVEGSKYILEAFGRLNFVGVLVDGIKAMPNELRACDPSDLSTTLASISQTITLLLRISQTRTGATALLNASLFPAIRASAIFATDPDIGLDIENPAALRTFFDLVQIVLKVVVSVFLSRGTGNEQMKNIVRDFLNDSRGSMVAIFKRNAKIGAVRGAEEAGDGEEKCLGEIVDLYTLLVSATGWLDFEDAMTTSQRAKISVFS